MIAVLVIPVLQQLTQLSKRLVTIGTMVGQIGHHTTAIIIVVGQEGCCGQVRAHTFFTIRIVVNMLSRSFLWTVTTGTVPTFNVLDGIRTRGKIGFTTYGTRNRTGTMNLHMHLQIVLTCKGSTACFTVIGRRRRGIHAIDTPRIATAFTPLIVGIIIFVVPITTVGTNTATLDTFHTPGIPISLIPLIVGILPIFAIVVTIGAVPAHGLFYWLLIGDGGMDGPIEYRSGWW
jgi:hypothetical protein